MLLQRILFSILLFLTIVPVSFLSSPQPAGAVAFGLVPCALNNDNPATSWDDRGPCTLCHFMLGLKNIVIFLRNIMTACAIAVIVAMAIIYITSAGNEGQMQLAKEGIKWSLVGFTIILLAWVAVNFIFTLPLFANNGLVRTGWDTFTCNTTSQVANGSYVATTSGITNATGGPASSLPPGRGGPPTTPPTPEPGNTSCNNNGTCDGGETCSTCAADCGACIPPNGFGCGIRHYECVNGESETPLELGDSWIWTCRGTGSHISESRSCTERKPVCGDGIVNQASEQCDKGVSNNGDACPATCSIACQTRDCGPQPTGGAACGRVEVNRNDLFCAEGTWNPPADLTPTCVFTASELICNWRCVSVDGNTTVTCSGRAPWTPNGRSCNYSGGTLTWGAGCRAEVPATTFFDGEFRSFPNGTAGYTGSISYSCNDGTLTQTDSSCN